MTKVYEFVALFSPEMTEQEVQVAQDSIVTLVKKCKGKVQTNESWGKKPLAYTIQKKTEAYYVFFVLELDTAEVQHFVHEVELNNSILRHLLLIQEEHLRVPSKAKDIDHEMVRE